MGRERQIRRLVAMGYVLLGCLLCSDCVAPLELPIGQQPCLQDADCIGGQRCLGFVCGGAVGNRPEGVGDGAAELPQEPGLPDSGPDGMPDMRKPPDREPSDRGPDEALPDARPDKAPSDDMPCQQNEELCGDGKDNNCNDKIDEGCPCQKLFSRKDHQARVTGLAFRSADIFYSSSTDNKLLEWSVKGQSSTTYLSRQVSIFGLAISAGGRLALAVGSRLLLPPEKMAVDQKHTGRIAGLTFGPSEAGQTSDYVGSASINGEIAVWNLKTSKIEARTSVAGEEFHAVAYQSQGFLWAGGKGGALYAWDQLKPKLKLASSRVLDATQRIRSLAFPPKGPWMLVGMSSGSIYLVNAEKDKLAPVVVAAHQGPVTALDVSSKGALVVSASEDMTAKIWQVQGANTTPTLVQRALLQHDDKVSSARFGPGARPLLTTGTLSGAVTAWRCP